MGRHRKVGRPSYANKVARAKYHRRRYTGKGQYPRKGRYYPYKGMTSGPRYAKRR